MSKYAIYALNILFLALPLAILEIIFEKTNGWGSGFDKRRWYARQFAPESSIVKAVVRLLNIELPLNYHVFVFVCVLPIFMAVEYIFLTRNLLLLLSCYFAVLLFEDFLWFVLNWNFDSLNQLTKGPKGSIWWHKSWLPISSGRYLPASYPIGLTLSSVFLLLA